MKRKIALVVLFVAALSLAGNVALAFGDCAGKSHAPIKTATQSTAEDKTSG